MATLSADCGQHILVVDDDPEMRLLLRRFLEQEGYRISEAENRAELRQRLDDGVDLITLDLKLRHDDGLAITREIRSRSSVPIIMVTAKDDPIDRVVGLEVGADDYISKPFYIREVLARVRSVLRRAGERSPGQETTEETGPDVFSFGEWTANFANLELRSKDGNPHNLTVGQLKLLELLVKNQGEVFTRDRIMDQLKGHDWSATDRSIDNQIARLRKVIEQDPRNPLFIKTVHGTGYKFAADVEPASHPSQLTTR